MTPCEDVRAANETVEEGREDDLRSLMDALAILSEEQRNVVLLRHVVGLSPPEIAEHLGRSESSIHGLHYRARGAMQAHLVGAGAGPTIALAGHMTQVTAERSRLAGLRAPTGSHPAGELIELMRLDRHDPELYARLIEAVERIASRVRSRSATKLRHSSMSSPPTARSSMPSGCRLGQKRSRSRCVRWDRPRR